MRSSDTGIALKKANFDPTLPFSFSNMSQPDMSGWDIFEKLKGKVKSKFAFLSAIPVSEERMKELRRAGVSDYITKPFTKTDLVKRISKILR